MEQLKAKPIVKLSIIVGHTLHGKDKGAIAYNGVSESEYNDKVARLVKEYHKATLEVMISYRDNTTYKKIAQNIKDFAPDVHMELHFNSFSKAAYGCECLALEDDKSSIAFADLVTNFISSSFNTKERNGNGVLKIGKNGRGYLNLKLIRDVLPKKTPVVLVEPFFANVRTVESEAFLNGHEKYAGTLAESALTWDDNKEKWLLPDGSWIEDLPRSPSTAKQYLLGFVKKGYGV